MLAPPGFRREIPPRGQQNTSCPLVVKSHNPRTCPVSRHDADAPGSLNKRYFPSQDQALRQKVGQPCRGLRERYSSSQSKSSLCLFGAQRISIPPGLFEPPRSCEVDREAAVISDQGGCRACPRSHSSSLAEAGTAWQPTRTLSPQPLFRLHPWPPQKRRRLEQPRPRGSQWTRRGPSTPHPSRSPGWCGISHCCCGGTGRPRRQGSSSRGSWPSTWCSWAEPSSAA